MNWIFFSLLTAVGFGMSDVFTKVASDKISAFSGVVFLHLTSGVIALCLMFALPFFGFEKQQVTSSGIFYSIVAGVFLFIGGSSYFFMFDKGAPLGIGVLVTTLGVISITLIASTLFLKEPLSMQQIVGILLGLVSVYLLVPKG